MRNVLIKLVLTTILTTSPGILALADYYGPVQGGASARTEILSIGGVGTRAVERNDSYEVERFNLRFKNKDYSKPIVRESYSMDQPILVYEDRFEGRRTLVSIYARDDLAFGLTADKIAQMLQKTRNESGKTAWNASRYSVNGLEGILLTVDQTESSHDDQKYKKFKSVPRAAETVAWVATKNGYYYAVDVTSEHLSNKEMVRRLKELASNLTQIDPERISSNFPLKTTVKYVSKRFPYNVIAESNNWKTFLNKESLGTNAEYVATDPRIDAWLGVFPVDLHGTTPSLDALSTALLSLIGYSEMAGKIISEETISRDGVPAMQIDLERTVDGVAHLTRCEVIIDHGVGYLVLVTLPKDRAENKIEVFNRLASVQLLHVPRDPEKRKETKKEELIVENIVFSHLGQLYLNNKQYELALEYYRHAYEAMPNDDTSMIGTLNAYNLLKRYQDGLYFLEKNINHFPQSYDVVSYQAFFQSQLGKRKEAIKNYEASFSLGRREDDDLIQYIWLRWDTGNKDDVLREAKYYATNTDSIRIKRLVGDLYYNNSDYEKAANIYASLRERAPYDQTTVTSLIETNYRLSRNKDVIDLCDEMISHGYKSADHFFYRGRSQYALKWYKEAKQSFESALALNPTDQASNEYLSHVSGMLGQGSTQSVNEPIEPVPLPKYLATLSGKPKPHYKEEDAIHLLKAKGFYYVPGKEKRQTIYMKTKILTKSGVDAFSTLQYRFDPLKERIFVNDLKVRDEKGAVVASGELSKSYVMDDTSSGLATGDKILNVPIPALAPGYTIDIAVSYRDLRSAEKFGFEGNPMFGGYPAEISALYITGNYQNLKWRIPSNAKELTELETRLWVVNNVRPFKQEYAQENPQEYMPFIWLGDKRGSWSEVGRSYLEEIKDKLFDNQQVTRLAEELTARAITTEDKVKTISLYVQSHLTYKAIEFGKRGIIPNSADETLNNRYGDCKDHAVLLYKLLTAVNIDAHLALVNVNQSVAGDFPSLDQFNHMIIFCADCGLHKYIDVTEKNLEPVGRTPMGLAENSALILDSNNSRLEKMDAYLPEDSSIRTDRTVDIFSDGKITVHELVQLNGYVASGIRGSLKELSSQERLDYVQRLLRSIDSKATFTLLETTNLNDVTKPLVLRMEYSLASQFIGVQDHLVGKSPSLWERYWFWYEPTQSRETPFVLRYPVNMVSKVILRPPSDYETSEDVAQSASARNVKFVQWKGKTARLESGVSIDYSAQLYPGHFRSDDYQLFGQEVSQAFSFVEKTLMLRKKNK